MEFYELAKCQLRQNSIRSFALISSGLHVAALGSTSEAYVLELKHSPLGTHTFPYRVETVKLPTTMPISGVLHKFDAAQLYSKFNVLKRQYITLDPLFVSELSTEPSKIQPVCIQWAPTKMFHKKTMAVLASNGVCELRHKDMISREWKICVCALNEFYKEIFPGKLGPTNTFDELRQEVENYFTTSFSWNLEPTESPFAFVTTNATGWILLYSVDEAGQIHIQSKYETSMGRISRVYLIRYLIVACASNGVIETFSVNENKIDKVDTLWSKIDRLPSKLVHITFHKEYDKWFLVTSKSSHVLAFVLHESGKAFLKKTVYLGNMDITGFEMLSPHQYIFVTINGTIELITLKIINGELKIDVQKIKHEFDSKNYQIVGLVSSPNRTAWTFMLFHNKPYTHPSAYSGKDAFVSICSLNTKDAFTLLKRNIGTRANMLDCSEIVRLDIIKNNITSKYESVPLECVGINLVFLRKLQLKLLVLNAEQIYQRLKYNHVKTTLSTEINTVKRMIECVYIGVRLRFLRNLKQHTQFQLLTGKCMKYKLKQLQIENISKEDIHKNAIESLSTLCSGLLLDFDSFFEGAKEKCSYCFEDINFDTLMCSKSHLLPRCSITYQQVPLFSKLNCSICLRPYTADDENLKSIFADSEDIKCTFCGFIFSDTLNTFNILD